VLIGPRRSNRPRQRSKAGCDVSLADETAALFKQPLHERASSKLGNGSRAACEIAACNLEEIGELHHAARTIRGWQPVVLCGHGGWRHPVSATRAPNNYILRPRPRMPRCCDLQVTIITRDMI